MFPHLIAETRERTNRRDGSAVRVGPEAAGQARPARRPVRDERATARGGVLRRARPRPGRASWISAVSDAGRKAVPAGGGPDGRVEPGHRARGVRAVNHTRRSRPGLPMRHIRVVPPQRRRRRPGCGPCGHCRQRPDHSRRQRLQGGRRTHRSGGAPARTAVQPGGGDPGATTAANELPAHQGVFVPAAAAARPSAAASRRPGYPSAPQPRTDLARLAVLLWVVFVVTSYATVLVPPSVIALGARRVIWLAVLLTIVVAHLLLVLAAVRRRSA